MNYFCIFATETIKTYKDMRKFFLRTTKKSGEATLFFQLRSKKHGLNLNHVNTGVKVNISKWIAAQSDEEAKDQWKETPEGKEVYRQLRAIDEAINNLLECSEVSKADVEEVMSRFRHETERKANDRMTRSKQEEEEAKKREILNYMDFFINGIEKQTRVSKRNHGVVIGKGSLNNYRGLQAHLRQFLADMPHLKFDEISEGISEEFRAYLRGCNLMPQTFNRLLKNMRAVCKAALSEKYATDQSILDFWGTTTVVWEHEKKTEIFLTGEEIEALSEMELTDPTEQQARDLFLFGYATGQRFSDYGDITPDDVVEYKGRILLDRRQKKTRSKVIVEVEDPRAVEILKRYGNNLPKMEHTRFNRTIKNLFSRLRCAVPSLGEMVATTMSGREKNSEEYFARLIEKKTKGERLTEAEERAYYFAIEKQKLYGGIGSQIYRRDSKGRIFKPKYMLVGSHTARRSFVTNEINNETLDRREIMSITGHKNDKILEQYDLTQKYEAAIKVGGKRREARAKKSGTTISINKVN